MAIPQSTVHDTESKSTCLRLGLIPKLPLQKAEHGRQGEKMLKDQQAALTTPEAFSGGILKKDVEMFSDSVHPQLTVPHPPTAGDLSWALL